MKIKVAILEQDQNYLSRITSVFSTKYADKFELYSFSEVSVALATIANARIDVLVASDVFEIDVNLLPKRCGFAYFVDSADVETVRDQKAICKFQKADLIYKQILSIYSENAGSVSELKLGDDMSRLIVFSSPCGGVGTSCMAAACALHFAALGRKTLYLNLEKYGSSDLFFEAEGQFDMSDIIFALKSKRSNLALKLESCVKQDARGVYFFAPSKLALDMLELDSDDVHRLITELRLSGSYEYIILDCDFAMDAADRGLLRQTNAVVWIGDGSDISNAKLVRAYQALTILEQQEDLPLTSRISLIYNKFSNKTSSTIEGAELRNIGGAPRYEHATIQQVLGQLAGLLIFDKIA